MNVSIFTFEKPEAAADAVEELHRLGIGGIQVMSPVPNHRLEEAMGTGSSRTGPVHWFSLAGAVIGCALGWCLTILCSLAYPVYTSGRPLVSPHVYFITVYELTLLTAIVMTLVGFLAVARLPHIGKACCGPAASWDKVVVVVNGSDTTMDEIIERCGGVRA